MSYMEQKTHQRQTMIVTLSDQNTKEIQDIRDQKNAMLAAYEEKKAKLRAILLEKETALAKIKQELDDLAEYKVRSWSRFLGAVVRSILLFASAWPENWKT